MKHTILILAFLFIASVYHSSHSLAGDILKKNSNGNIGYDTMSFEKIHNYRIYSKDNSPANFSRSESYIIVLKNNHNCIDCFRQLNDFAHANKNEIQTHFIVLAQIDSTTLDRKRNFSENSRLMPDFENYFFEYHHQGSKSFFDDLQTNYTPEIIVITHGKIYHIPYSEIFDHNSLSISINTQINIGELLK